MAEIPRLDEIQSKSRREHVLDSLRDAILDGDLKPGQSLKEAWLASQLGVSRAPLREALQILSAEGLVEMVPYHVATVRALTRTDIEELYSLRGALEAFAIQRIIARRDPGDIEQLQVIYGNMREAAARGDLKRLSGEDQHFHNTLIMLSRHNMLLSMWNFVHVRVQQVMALRNKQNRDLSQIAANHVPIIEAIIAGDAEQATQLIQRHVASAADLILDDWEYNQEDGGQ